MLKKKALRKIFITTFTCFTLFVLYLIPTKFNDNYLNPNGFLIFKIGINQATKIKEFFIKSGYKNIFVEKDVSGIERVIGGQILN